MGGSGIHREVGAERGAMEPAHAIVGGLSLRHGEHVALLVNNLGGTASGELSIVAGSALRRFSATLRAVRRRTNGPRHSARVSTR